MSICLLNSNQINREQNNVAKSDGLGYKTTHLFLPWTQMCVYTCIRKCISFRQEKKCQCVCLCGWLLPLPSVSLSLLSVCPWLVSSGHMVEPWLLCEIAVLTGSVHVWGFRASEVPAQFFWEKWLCFGNVAAASLFCAKEVWRCVIYSRVCWQKDWAWLLSNFFWINVPYCSPLFSEKCLSGEWSKVWNSLTSQGVLLLCLCTCILILELVNIMMPLSVCLVTTQ